MGFHTFDPARASKLDDPTRFQYVSVEELLGALEGGRVLDLGSGTGFYSSRLAPAVEELLALDLEPAMHGHFRETGVPENVHLLTAVADHLPLRSGSVDGVVSTMTYHEFATPAALSELARVCPPGAPVVLADWSADGPGEAGPPTTERYTAAEATEALTAAGFTVDRMEERRETWLLVASAE
ncbi:class I SAM-dependent methyltransferase [Natronomonas sp. EA1]|uniref:class I SAM-dependent methyltransferase n=1 Tax=Natronomonas sp. EA1 TaxID=3421655 RepID=UPI003EBB8E24